MLHGGDNDVTSLRRDFGLRFRTIFDTGLAARLLGDTEVGLQALVRNELGIELHKGSQRDDWSKRPLTPKQETYALGDVLHLMALATRMTDRLAAAGRIAWAREEFAAMANLPLPVDKRTGPEAFRRIKGSARLSPRKQAVLRELYDWREARAAAADRPPFKIIAAEKLLELAEDPPETVEEVEDALASHARLVREADAVLAAIERGLDLPERDLPARDPGDKKPRLSAAARRRHDALKAWRDEQAAGSGLDPATVMPLRLIDRVAEVAPRTFRELAAIEGIRQWRVDAWGDALLDACAG